MRRMVVLLAEDEPNLRDLVAMALEQDDFIVLPTCSAEEALQIFRIHTEVDVLLADVQLGFGMSGVELAEQILKEQPGTKALLISGWPDSEILAAEKNLPFLSKPFSPNALVERVRRICCK